MPEARMDDEQLMTAAEKGSETSEPARLPESLLEPCTPPISGSRRMEAYVDETRHPYDHENSDGLPEFEGPSGFQQMQQSATRSVVDEIKQHVDKSMLELQAQNRKDHEIILMAMQQESAKRTALEQRLYSNLLAQSETMVAMELKLLRLEAKIDRRETAQTRAIDNPRSPRETAESQRNAIVNTPAVGVASANVAFVSSANSLASGVTAESFPGDGDDMDRPAENNRNDDNEDVDSQRSTPTFGSRSNNLISGGNLESILLSPTLAYSHASSHSMRATRGDSDGNSSLGTSVTGSTFTSTVATRADSLARLESFRPESVRGRFFSLDPESRRTTSALTMDSQETSMEDARPSRSRSNSPITTQSEVADVPSVASGASQSTAIMSSVAVAGPRVRRALRGETAPDSRPLANRVVSFTTDLLQNEQAVVNAGNCDSITMPDELDNLSEVADTFAASARTWREEYEARLEALQKRMVNE